MEPTASARKRVIYVITKASWGGAQRYVYDMATASHAQGYAVRVVAGGEGELLIRLRQEGIETLSLPTLGRDVRLSNELKTFTTLLTLFKDERPDVVHLNSSKAGISALAATVAGVKNIIFTVHGWAWNERRPVYQKILIAYAYWVTLILSHRVVMVSHEARRQGRLFPFVQGRILVIHNGIHPIPFFSRMDARRKLLPDSKRTLWIGTIGELHPIKGQSLLLEAFEHFSPDFPHSELVIVGTGEQESALQEQIRLEGLGARAHLLGYVPDAAMYMQAFDIFVLPSRSEGFPYVLLEAGQAGLAVVATNVGGIPEIVSSASTGLLVPYGNRAALTSALASVASNDALRKNVGNALKSYVEKEFSLTRMINETLVLY